MTGIATMLAALAGIITIGCALVWAHDTIANVLKEDHHADPDL